MTISTQIPSIFKFGNREGYTLKIKTNLFSEYFFSVFSTDTPDPNTDLPPYSGSCLDHVDINVQDVYAILRSLHTTKVWF